MTQGAAPTGRGSRHLRLSRRGDRQGHQRGGQGTRRDQGTGRDGAKARGRLSFFLAGALSLSILALVAAVLESNLVMVSLAAAVAAQLLIALVALLRGRWS